VNAEHRKHRRRPGIRTSAFASDEIRPQGFSRSIPSRSRTGYRRFCNGSPDVPHEHRANRETGRTKFSFNTKEFHHKRTFAAITCRDGGGDVETLRQDSERSPTLEESRSASAHPAGHRKRSQFRHEESDSSRRPSYSGGVAADINTSLIDGLGDAGHIASASLARRCAMKSVRLGSAAFARKRSHARWHAGQNPLRDRSSPTFVIVAGQASHVVTAD
jgi:hypothetical protein